MAETFDIKALATDLVKYGAGFAIGGYAGRYVEDKYITTPVSTTSTLVEKLTAWAANNGPKMGAYFLAKIAKQNDIAGAFAGSIAFDSIVRYVNNGPNNIDVRLQGYRIMNQNNNNVQRLIQENAGLRSQLDTTIRNIPQPQQNRMSVAQIPPRTNHRQTSGIFGML